MLKESISIKNFGPIVEAEINDIKPLLVLIGSSGSGKSTVLKLLSIFRWLYKRACIKTFLKNAGVKKLGGDVRFKTLLSVSGIDEYLQPNTRIVYTRGDTNIVYADKKLNSGNLLVPELSCDKIAFISDKRSIIADFLEHKFDKRAGGYYLQDTIDNFMIAKDDIKEYDLDFLGVKFKEVKGNNDTRYRFVGLDEDFDVRVSAGSSGMQTATPLCMITEYFAHYFNPVKAFSDSLWKFLSESDNLSAFNSAINVGDIPRRNVHLLVEEPELNLDPFSQIQLVEQLIATCFNGPTNAEMTLSMATHSPYILNSLNLYIQRRRQKADSIGIDESQISAYEIAAGTAIDLKVPDKQGLTIVNALSMSEPLSEIYAEYNRLAAK